MHADAEPVLAAARVARPADARSPLTGLAGVSTELLALEDPELHALICAEQGKLEATISLSATASVVDPTTTGAMTSVLAARAAHAVEYSGVEQLAVGRAMRAFGAARASVRLSDVDAAIDAAIGTDGALLAPVGTHARAHYPPGDPHALRARAEQHRPDAILCGGSDIPMIQEFADIANSVDALLICDISELAMLVITGSCDNPVDVAHLTVLSTSDQLGGPSGAIALVGAPGESCELLENLSSHHNSLPTLQSLAGIARALDIAGGPRGAQFAAQMITNAQHLADELTELGQPVHAGEPGGPVVDCGAEPFGVPAPEAHAALRDVNLAVDRPLGTLRFGVQAATHRGFGPSEMRQLGQLIHSTLSAMTEHPATGWELDEFTRLTAGEAVLRLVRQFPLPRHVPASYWSAVS